jgi:hypothetical protein
MHEKRKKLLNLLGTVSVQFLVLASTTLHFLVRLTGKAVVLLKPLLQRLKRNFLNLPRKHQYIVVACGVFLVLAGIESLLTETTNATVSECEQGACGFWAFHGKAGEGYWRNGAASKLAIEHFNPYFVDIVSTLTQGPGAGMVVRYDGKRSGNHIVGTYTSVWPGHKALPPGTWSADIDDVTADQAWHLSQVTEKQGDMFGHIHWLMTGVGLEDKRAEDDLGYSYINGYGTPVNYDKAQQLFRVAAAQGSKEAASNLGHMYEMGLGVKKDQAQADAWYKKSGLPQQAAVPASSGGFFDTLAAIGTQAGQQTDAVLKARAAGGNQAGQDKMNEILFGMLQKKMQINAANWAACQKSPECMEEVQREQNIEDMQKLQQQETYEYNVNHSNLYR